MHLVKIAVDYSSASIIHPKLTDLIRDPVSKVSTTDRLASQTTSTTACADRNRTLLQACKQPARMAYKGQLFVFLRK